jgi:hypothetical protein
MTKIEFRASIETVLHADMTPAYRRIRVPELAARHCDMPAFRQHKRYGGLANSALFPGILRRIRLAVTGSAYSDHIRLDRLPAGVTVDDTGFLARVTIDADAIGQ